MQLTGKPGALLLLNFEQARGEIAQLDPGALDLGVLLGGLALQAFGVGDGESGGNRGAGDGQTEDQKQVPRRVAAGRA